MFNLIRVHNYNNNITNIQIYHCVVRLVYYYPPPPQPRSGKRGHICSIWPTLSDCVRLVDLQCYFGQLQDTSGQVSRRGEDDRGEDSTGLDWLGQEWAELDRAGLDWTGLGPTGLDKSWQDWTGQDKTGTTAKQPVQSLSQPASIAILHLINNSWFLTYIQ